MICLFCSSFRSCSVKKISFRTNIYFASYCFSCRRFFCSLLVSLKVLCTFVCLFMKKNYLWYTFLCTCTILDVSSCTVLSCNLVHHMFPWDESICSLIWICNIHCKSICIGLLHLSFSFRRLKTFCNSVSKVRIIFFLNTEQI